MIKILGDFAYWRSRALERKAKAEPDMNRRIRLLDRALLWQFREHYWTGLMPQPLYLRSVKVLRRAMAYRRRHPLTLVFVAVTPSEPLTLSQTWNSDGVIFTGAKTDNAKRWTIN